MLANEHQLVFGGPFPFFIIEGKPFAAQVKNMPLRALLKPENAFCSENILGELVVQKILKLANSKGAIALKRQGGKSIHR